LYFFLGVTAELTEKDPLCPPVYTNTLSGPVGIGTVFSTSCASHLTLLLLDPLAYLVKLGPKRRTPVIYVVDRILAANDLAIGPMAVDAPLEIFTVDRPNADEMQLDPKQPVLVHAMRLVDRVAPDRVPPLLWKEDRGLVDRLRVVVRIPAPSTHDAFNREHAAFVGLSLAYLLFSITISIY
jgi:hypothetical protein